MWTTQRGSGWRPTNSAFELSLSVRTMTIGRRKFWMLLAPNKRLNFLAMTQRFAKKWDHEPALASERPTPTFWVVCPRCESCAILLKEKNFPCRINCSVCGHIKQFLTPEETEAWDSATRKAHYSHELWLRTTCCGHVLRAPFPKYLEFLEDYVSSPLRERLRRNWPDREYLATLPKWLCLAKN